MRGSWRGARLHQQDVIAAGGQRGHGRRVALDSNGDARKAGAIHDHERGAIFETIGSFGLDTHE